MGKFTDPNDIMAIHIMLGWFIIPFVFAGGGMLLTTRIVRPWANKRFTSKSKCDLLEALFIIVWGAICLLGGFLLIPLP